MSRWSDYLAYTFNFFHHLTRQYNTYLLECEGVSVRCSVLQYDSEASREENVPHHSHPALSVLSQVVCHRELKPRVVLLGFENVLTFVQL